MNFTFGITTDYSAPDRIKEVVQSINALKIPNFEILIITGSEIEPMENVRHIRFDENQKPNWVTRKKNILAEEATFNNVVLMHDYFVFDKDWYKNFLEFGEEWDVCSNAQLMMNGKRHFTDWVMWDSPIFPRYTSIPYDDWTQTAYMYQSGGYMIVKKRFMERFPMNENMTWGSAEDVEWSLRMRDRAIWKCNGNSIVKHNKIHRDMK
jgi:hypothetical protein